MASTAHKAMAKQTLAAMWPEDGESEEANAFMGYLVFVGIRLAMATAAALLVYWQVSTPRVGGVTVLLVYWQPDSLAYLPPTTYYILPTTYHHTPSQPHAAVSGLPKIKSNLNGTKIPGYLSFRVLVAKIVGTTLVVGSGLPLGKEGPMVHIGATVASLISNVKVNWMHGLVS